MKKRKILIKCKAKYLLKSINEYYKKDIILGKD